MEDRPISITDPKLAAKLGNTRFYSATYRLFKLDDLELACEDHGQAVIYHGGIADAPHTFVLDKHHHIETGKVFPVCGNTYRMLHDSRFAPYFSFIGDFSQHFGIFQGCGSVLPYDNDNGTANPGACC